MSFIEIKDIKKEYRLDKTTVCALKGINLNIEKCDFVAIAGASGSGKSTLLNLIGCLDYPTSGKIMIDQKNTSDLTEKQLNRLRLYTMGFIFQSYNLISVLNIYENVEIPLLIIKGISAAERKKRVNYYLDSVGLGNFAKRKPAELSGGQRQRVSIARALVSHPQVVLADEPTANLDSKTGIEIIELMHRINREHSTTFIFSTHDPKVIQRADRVIYIEDGVVKNSEKV